MLGDLSCLQASALCSQAVRTRGVVLLAFLLAQGLLFWLGSAERHGGQLGKRFVCDSSRCAVVCKCGHCREVPVAGLLQNRMVLPEWNVRQGNGSSKPEESMCGCQETSMQQQIFSCVWPQRKTVGRSLRFPLRWCAAFSILLLVCDIRHGNKGCVAHRQHCGIVDKESDSCRDSSLWLVAPLTQVHDAMHAPRPGLVDSFRCAKRLS